MLDLLCMGMSGNVAKHPHQPLSLEDLLKTIGPRETIFPMKKLELGSRMMSIDLLCLIFMFQLLCILHLPTVYLHTVFMNSQSSQMGSSSFFLKVFSYGIDCHHLEISLLRLTTHC